jgi:hypothetical protein
MRCLFCIAFFIQLPLFLVGQSLNVSKKLILSAPLAKESLERSIFIKNSSSSEASINQLLIRGRHATDFHLNTVVTFPLSIPADDSVELSFTFKPKENIGIHTSTLQINSAAFDDGQALVQLVGLANKGMEGENEPSLHTILETLGYAIDIGGTSLKLGTEDSLLGDEVQLKQFVSASSEKVQIIPVARFSPEGQVPFGYYQEKDSQLMYNKVGTLSEEYLQHQSLFPRLTSGKTSFAPEKGSFGIFISTDSHATYTDYTLNTEVEHACRVYPLKDSDGNTIENHYLICFEEATNGDYQDFVFVISNVSPYIAP